MYIKNDIITYKIRYNKIRLFYRFKEKKVLLRNKKKMINMYMK